MPTTADRRAPENRRQRLDPREPLERRRERRREDRRSSVRALRRFTIRERPEGPSHEYRGDVSLEGVTFYTDVPLMAAEVEVHLRLPDLHRIAHIRGVVSRAQPLNTGAAIHVRFEELDVPVGLALARLLDFEMRLSAAHREEPTTTAALPPSSVSTGQNASPSEARQ